MALGLDALPATRGAIDPGDVEGGEAEQTSDWGDDIYDESMRRRMRRRRYGGLLSLVVLLVGCSGDGVLDRDADGDGVGRLAAVERVGDRRVHAHGLEQRVDLGLGGGPTGAAREGQGQERPSHARNIGGALIGSHAASARVRA